MNFEFLSFIAAVNLQKMFSFSDEKLKCKQTFADSTDFQHTQTADTLFYTIRWLMKLTCLSQFNAD